MTIAMRNPNRIERTTGIATLRRGPRPMPQPTHPMATVAASANAIFIAGGTTCPNAATRLVFRSPMSLSASIASPTGTDCGSCFATATARSQISYYRRCDSCSFARTPVLSGCPLVEEIQARVDVAGQTLADLGMGRFGQEVGALVGFCDDQGLVEDHAPAILVSRSAYRKGEAQEQHEQGERRQYGVAAPALLAGWLLLQGHR